MTNEALNMSSSCLFKNERGHIMCFVQTLGVHIVMPTCSAWIFKSSHCLFTTRSVLVKTHDVSPCCTKIVEFLYNITTCLHELSQRIPNRLYKLNLFFVNICVSKNVAYPQIGNSISEEGEPNDKPLKMQRFPQMF